jgi:hypothetical protein
MAEKSRLVWTEGEAKGFFILILTTETHPPSPLRQAQGHGGQAGHRVKTELPWIGLRASVVKLPGLTPADLLI